MIYEFNDPLNFYEIQCDENSIDPCIDITSIITNLLQT